MQIKKVRCPNCQAILDVRNTKNEDVKVFNCPRCGSLLRAKFPKIQEPVDALTYIPPMPKVPNSGKTQVGGAGNASPFGTKLPLRKRQKTNPRLVYNGRNYELEAGENIIGRKSYESSATVQIDTIDMYMSRQHVKIVVTSPSDGDEKYVLSNYKNMNRTKVNGQIVDKDDLIRLSDGDKISMGRTEITFKL